jgi:muramidase (phage lysozyme)
MIANLATGVGGIGLDIAKTAGMNFLKGAVGGTAAGAIANNFSSTKTGAKKTGRQSGETGDSGKDTVRAVRDLQSDFNEQAGDLKDISAGINNMGGALNSIDRTLKNIEAKIQGQGVNTPKSSVAENAALIAGISAAARMFGRAIPAIGATATGVSEYMESGNAGRAVASGAGTLGGALAGRAAAGAIGAGIGRLAGGVLGGVAGPAGSAVGLVGGGYLGDKAATAIYDVGSAIYNSIFGDNKSNKTDAMAELSVKEQQQKQKAAAEVEKQSINFNSREIIFKADSIKFETAGGQPSAGASFGGSSGSAPGGPGPSAAPGGPGPSAAPGGPGGSSYVPGAGTGGGGAGGGRSSGGGSGSFAAKDLPPEAQALLSTISSGESGGRYDIINYKAPGGGGRPSYFQGTRHPFEGRFGNTASGRYQFLWSTWEKEAKAMGIDPREFTPENQDRAAWSHAQRIYRQKTRRNLAEDMKNPEMHGYISSVLRPTWHGIGGGGQMTRELAKASGAGGAGAGGSITAATGVPGGAAVPSTPSGGGLSRTEMSALFGAGGMAGRRVMAAGEGGAGGVRRGYSPEVEAAAAQAGIATRGRFLNQGQFGPFQPKGPVEEAAAQARIAMRGRFLNQGQFGPNLPPPTDYGSSDAAYRAQEEAAAASAAMGAGGIISTADEVQRDATATDKILSKFNAQRVADKEAAAAAAVDPETIGAFDAKKWSEERQRGWLNAPENADSLKWAEQQKAKMDAERASMDAEAVGGVTGFDARAWAAKTNADAEQRRRDAEVVASQTGAGGFTEGSSQAAIDAALAAKAKGPLVPMVDPTTSGEAASRLNISAMETEAFRMKSYQAETNPASAMQQGFAGSGANEGLGTIQSGPALAPADLMRSYFGDQINIP